jgi:hypothetical protein
MKELAYIRVKVIGPGAAFGTINARTVVLCDRFGRELSVAKYQVPAEALIRPDQAKKDATK